MRSWPGWKSMKTIFSFGDSYTTTGFDAIAGPQPNAVNPLGNPNEPYYGHTSSNGPNWIRQLTTKYNQSFIKTFNLACGGATVASSLIHPIHPEYLSLEQQKSVLDLSASGGPTPEHDSWETCSTLFTFFLGINDAGLSYAKESPSVYDEYLAIYASLIDTIYAANGRHFLFLLVPPIDRSPLTTRQGRPASGRESIHIQAWNDGLSKLANDLRHNRPDASVFVFNTHALFSSVMDDATMFPETAIYCETTGFCEAYAMGTEAVDTQLPGCLYSVNQYLWLNDLHPTYPIHDLLAKQITDMLTRVTR
ncbi:hypothetical protein BGZ61DRAFT_371930 [Ilyonectria robusta]|uniref:uncharacterized protein n=1 Tax=Ilyonectria robusta TaxID=1079257 RepID=UPI001E8EC863|nr:uncharacterized protein BGZ61DRAFT_371930 [Ilyonectria robusta]KAH8656822.1 hypothetical protein BGZ61DRAFT_371930 [Ilyonectria robusta]